MSKIYHAVLLFSKIVFRKWEGKTVTPSFAWQIASGIWLRTPIKPTSEYLQERMKK